ncbi:MAG: PAS domain-containing protein, partial [Desulfuromonadales bacterium]|nr:PAS domain-containing protein [Desulfuromonadales bacterium]MBN2792501.1 PAS domain-containing protein [Desulfuromonadales bacterium]
NMDCHEPFWQSQRTLTPSRGRGFLLHTKIDFISCRNLLIYLEPLFQTKIIHLFNFSLVPAGLLFLGSSETVGSAADLFETLDTKWKLLRSKGIKNRTMYQQEDALFNLNQSSTLHFNLPNRVARGNHDFIYDRLLERFLNVIAEHYIPFAMLADDSGTLLHVVGESGRFLRIPSGKVQTNISKLLVKELAIPIMTGIQKVLKSKEMLSYTNIRLSDDKEQPVQLKICPVPCRPGAEDLIAIFIEDQKKIQLDTQDSNLDFGQLSEQRIIDLENELQFSQESLQATVEELETSNEELQATNEELLASNEELQSTNEELQSVNEELFTVNAEYQNKITELTEANNDLDNLVSLIHMPTVYLDENLEIRRVSPEAKKIFKFIDQDIGRPLSHIAHNLIDINLDQLIKKCQLTEEEIFCRVCDQQTNCFLLRIIPYRIAPQNYAGIILTFFDLNLLSGEKEVKETGDQP